MTAPDAGVAEAIAFGVVVHFVLSSGYAKLAVGDGLRGLSSLFGPNPGAVAVAVGSTKAKAGRAGSWWASPATMRHYFDVYSSSTSARPLSATLNRAIAGRDWATAGIGWGTLLLELVLIPGLLVAPPRARWIGAAAMVSLDLPLARVPSTKDPALDFRGCLGVRRRLSNGLVFRCFLFLSLAAPVLLHRHTQIVMHVGIAAAMSGLVGIAFFTSLPAYLTGFGCTCAVGSPEWLLAAAIGTAPTANFALLPEHWPSSPISLFMWSGAQAEVCAPWPCAVCCGCVWCAEPLHRAMRA